MEKPVSRDAIAGCGDDLQHHITGDVLVAATDSRNGGLTHLYEDAKFSGGHVLCDEVLVQRHKAMTYAQCNCIVNPNLHVAAFCCDTSCGMMSYMERKATPKPPKFKPTYIRQWRKHRGLKISQVVSRIIELAGESGGEDPSLRVPRTEASLSRIETGKQGYTQAVLEVLGDALNVHPAWLIERDPTKEGKVISLIDRASPAQLRQIEALLEEMLRTGTSG